MQSLPAIDAALCRDIYPGARLALPKLDGWHAELPDLLGYGELDRLEIDHDRCYGLPCVIYSEHLNGSTAPCVSRTAAQTFQRLRKRARIQPSPHEVIYVARSDTLRRQMRNEDQLIGLPENEGVTIVVPGRLSVTEQISMFSGAKIVIGAHGGGLTNIVFSPEDAIVYELLPSHFLNVCFNRLAQARGLNYWADQFPTNGAGSEHDRSWSVDLEVVKRRLSAMRLSVRAPKASSGELFRFFSSPGHAPIDTWHHYFPVYERYLGAIAI